ncbi:MAG: DUF2318 domain-containing protein [Thermodesulfobacteriota bacterium]
MKHMLVFSTMIALAAALAFSATSVSAAPQGSFMVQAQEVTPANGVFQFPAASFADGKAKHYVYKHSPNQWIRFFVVKSSDGAIRAAFDACDVCFKHKKGYVQQGDVMICVNCGLKFRTDKVNEVTGGCNPGALKRTQKDGNIIIAQQDVLDGLGYFK